MKDNPRVLIAGIGNIFLGDDAFGSEVARRLLGRQQPACVNVVDFGIRGVDLTYALTDGYDAAILIDACPRRQGEPGTLYVLELDLASAVTGMATIDPHSMDPMKVLQAAAAMGGCPPRVLLVGCEPSIAAAPASEETDMDDFGDAPMEMSPAVSRAVDEAVRLVETLIRSETESLLHRHSVNSTVPAPYLPPDAAEGAMPTEV